VLFYGLTVARDTTSEEEEEQIVVGVSKHAALHEGASTNTKAGTQSACRAAGVLQTQNWYS